MLINLGHRFVMLLKVCVCAWGCVCVVSSSYTVLASVLRACEARTEPNMKRASLVCNE